jgi:hypothetical protein
VLPDEILALAARSPAGLFCRKQVLKRRFRDHHIAGWRAAHLIEQVAWGWYRVIEASPPPTQALHLPLEYTRYKRVDAATALTDHSGLAALGVPGFALPCKATLLIEHHAQIRLRQAPWRTVHADFSTFRVLESGDFRVAEPGRCVADLHGRLRDPDAAVAAVDAVRAHLAVSDEELTGCWRRLGRHGGARALLRMADAGAFDGESPAERSLLATFARFPPAPDAQVWITPDFRADFAYVFAALVLEHYGEEWHAGRVDEDAVRIAVFRGEGWDAFITTKSLTRIPAALMATIHALRRERELAMLAGLLRRPSLPPQRGRRAPLRTLVPLG